MSAMGWCRARSLASAAAVSLLSGAAGASPLIYTLASVTPFDIAVSGGRLTGTLHAVTPAEVATWDLTTSGNDPNAPPGTHACDDLGFNPFASCSLEFILPATSLDVVAYSLSLDGGSQPLRDVSFFFAPALDVVAAPYAAYIIAADTSLRIPDGSTLGPSGSGGTFQNFADGSDTSFYVQPGESTVVLLTPYNEGDVAAALEGGSTPRFGFGGGSPLGRGSIAVSLVLVPEPTTFSLLGAGCVMLCLRARAQRRRRRPIVAAC
jgi:hypothetical protein